MLTIERTDVYGWEAAIRGMRNPLNSWANSDSEYSSTIDVACLFGTIDSVTEKNGWKYRIGKNDMALMQKLIKAGSDHSKFTRMIFVTCDIIAPLYWWKEYDTYKVGTVANSCSTMHKITEKKFEWDDFSHEHMIDCTLSVVIESLNGYLDLYHKQNDPKTHNEDYVSAKELWYNIIQLLPSSYNQRRTVSLNYAVLANIYHARRNHKLDEWHTLCDWIESLPYAKELITEVQNEKD